jgi:hypothetical protein
VTASSPSNVSVFGLLNRRVVRYQKFGSCSPRHSAPKQRKRYAEATEHPLMSRCRSLTQDACLRFRRSHAETYEQSGSPFKSGLASSCNTALACSGHPLFWTGRAHHRRQDWIACNIDLDLDPVTSLHSGSHNRHLHHRSCVCTDDSLLCEYCGHMHAKPAGLLRCSNAPAMCQQHLVCSRAPHV